MGWLTWVAKNTSIPVLKVYAFSSSGNQWITMEYVEGFTLDKAWKGLSNEESESLIKGMPSTPFWPPYIRLLDKILRMGPLLRFPEMNERFT